MFDKTTKGEETNEEKIMETKQLSFSIKLGHFEFSMAGDPTEVQPYLSAFGGPAGVKNLSETYQQQTPMNQVMTNLQNMVTPLVQSKLNNESLINDPLARLAHELQMEIDELYHIYLVDDGKISLLEEPSGTSKKEQRQNGALLFAIAYLYVHEQRDIPIKEIRQCLGEYNLVDGNFATQMKDLGAFKIDSSTYHLHRKGESIAKEVLKKVSE